MHALVAMLLVVVASTVPARAQLDCEAARCAVQRAVDQRCPCTPSATRGEYARCVATLVKELIGDGTVARGCTRVVKRCASRSVCGRPVGSVVCDIPKVSVACAIGFGFCRHPDGTILYTHPCSSDADCVLESRCTLSRSAAQCIARGGTVATRPRCCAECPPFSETPCGGLTCSANEICVIFGPVGPGGFFQACHPVPAECAFDPTCGCVGAALCAAPNVCHDTERPGAVIVCECTACV